MKSIMKFYAVCYLFYLILAIFFLPFVINRKAAEGNETAGKIKNGYIEFCTAYFTTLKLMFVRYANMLHEIT